MRARVTRGRHARCRAGTTGTWSRPGSWPPPIWGSSLSRPQTNVGLFLLPMVLALIGVGYAFRDGRAFPRDRALQAWGIAHGVMLLLGTVAVSLGFVAGVMYLVQSWRLKHNVPPQPGLKLPSLEWLQAVNKQSLIYLVVLHRPGAGGGHRPQHDQAPRAAGRPCPGPTAWSSARRCCSSGCWPRRCSSGSTSRPSKAARSPTSPSPASCSWPSSWRCCWPAGRSTRSRGQRMQSSEFRVQNSEVAAAH